MIKIKEILVRFQLVGTAHIYANWGNKHVPASVPWHFRDKVKAGLDADCRMGILEEVPGPLTLQLNGCLE